MGRSGATTANYLSKQSVAVITAPPFSVSCWMNMTSVSADQIPFSVCSVAGGTNNGHDLQMDSALKRFKAESSDATNFVAANDGTGVNTTTSTLYHIVGVWASSTSRVCYRDNQKGTVETTSRVPTSQARTYLFKAQGGAAITGSIWWLGVWNLALADQDVTSLFSGAHPRRVRPEGLISCLNLTGNLSPDPDLCNASGWPVTGTLTEVPNIRIYM